MAYLVSLSQHYFELIRTTKASSFHCLVAEKISKRLFGFVAIICPPGLTRAASLL